MPRFWKNNKTVDNVLVCSALFSLILCSLLLGIWNYTTPALHIQITHSLIPINGTIVVNGASRFNFPSRSELENDTTTATNTSTTEMPTVTPLEKSAVPPKLPDLDPFSPNFTKYLKATGSLEFKCYNDTSRRVEPWMKVVNGNKIVFSVPPEVRGNVTCRVRELRTWVPVTRQVARTIFWKGRTMKGFAGDIMVEDDTEANSQRVLEATHTLEKSDFAAINCFSSSHGIKLARWDSLLSGIHKVEKFKQKQQLQDVMLDTDEEVAQDEHQSKKPLNVFIFVVDAVSRFAAENLMPQTMNYLRQHLQAAVFKHHTIVGENSLPNVVAMLTGMRLRDMPWSRRGALLDYPLIWKDFSDKGYVTAYMEDWSTTFRADTSLYANAIPPTDHLGLIFGYYVFGRRRGMCAFQRPAHEFHLHLPDAMWQVYPKTQPKFFLGWFDEYSHEEVTGAAFLDGPLTQMLHGMHTKGFLNDTLTILMGDHGNRYMKAFRQTTAGRFDHRTPFLAIIPPLAGHPLRISPEGNADVIVDHGWGNLWRNVDKLTSHYDIHATLWDILHGPKGQQSFPDPDYPYPGVSLLTPIKSTRTCNEAGIPAKYCPYIDWTANAMPLIRMQLLGWKFAHFINNYQKEYFAKFGVNSMPCEEKSLRRAQNGGILEQGRFYLVLFAGSGPFGAEFEVTGTYEGKFKNVQFSIQDVSRLDRFGDRPYCLRNFPETDEKKIMELLCYCIKDSDGPAVENLNNAVGY